jgi:hypothetical protein
VLNSPVLYSWQTGANRIRTPSPDTGLAAEVDRFAGRYLGLLQRAGLNLIELVRPEIFPVGVDRKDLFGSEKPVHLIFKPPPDIRVLKGAYNIGVLQWDSPGVSGQVLRREPFSNQIRMLSLLDEIWVGSSAVQSMFRQAGLHRTYVVPCPASDIAAAECEKQERDGSTTSRSFAGEANTFVAEFDSRRETNATDTVVEAFRGLPEQPWRLILVCRDQSETAVAAARFSYSGQNRSPGREAQPRLSFVSATDERKRDAVLAAADYFISASAFEGQSLALVDAILCGCIPVIAEFSANRDFLNQDSALELEAVKKRVRFRPGDPDTKLVDTATITGCMNAIRKAMNLEHDVRDRLRAQAVHAVQRRFSMEAVQKAVASRFSQIAAGNGSV